LKAPAWTNSRLVDPAQPAGVIDVRKRPLDVLAAASHQLLPMWTADPAAIAVDGLLGLRLLGPAPAAAIGLRKVAADSEGLEGQQGVVAVIAPIADERRRDGRLHGCQLFGRRPARGRGELSALTRRSAGASRRRWMPATGRSPSSSGSWRR
jgi:hypothetical protein